MASGLFVVIDYCFTPLCFMFNVLPCLYVYMLCIQVYLCVLLCIKQWPCYSFNRHISQSQSSCFFNLLSVAVSVENLESTWTVFVRQILYN